MQKDIITIIKVSQEKTAKLSVGKFGSMNLEMFLAALSTSFSYFSVLINVIGDKPF